MPRCHNLAAITLSMQLFCQTMVTTARKAVGKRSGLLLRLNSNKRAQSQSVRGGSSCVPGRVRRRAAFLYQAAAAQRRGESRRDLCKGNACLARSGLLATIFERFPFRDGYYVTSRGLFIDMVSPWPVGVLNILSCDCTQEFFRNSGSSANF